MLPIEVLKLKTTIYGAFKFNKDATPSAIYRLNNNWCSFYCGGEYFQGFEKGGSNQLCYVNDGGVPIVVYENGNWVKDHYRTILFYEKDSTGTYGSDAIDASEVVDAVNYECDQTFFSYTSYPSEEAYDGLTECRGGWVFPDHIGYGVASTPSLSVSIPFYSNGAHNKIEVVYSRGYGGWTIKYDGTRVYSPNEGWINPKHKIIIFKSNSGHGFNNEESLHLCSFLLANASENAVLEYKGESHGATVGSRIYVPCGKKYLSENIKLYVAPCVGNVVCYYHQKKVAEYNINQLVSGDEKGRCITFDSYREVATGDISISINK